MRRTRRGPLVLILAVTVIALTATFVAGNSPSLGLDLQGGASVVLEPPEGTPSGAIDQAIEIIRNRVDALGVAEPEITRQGNAVAVELPGVKDQQRALEVVGDTAELRFRPVLAVLPPEDATTTTTSTTATTVPQDPNASTTTTAPTTTTTPGTTPREENLADQQVVLPGRSEDGEAPERYVLGPAALLGKEIDSASAKFTNNEWAVHLNISSDGIASFNELAAKCYSGAPECPSQGGGPGQMAIELDGVVMSAPSVNEASFERDGITISGNFSEGDAKDLALVLRYGSLPVQLEQQTVRTVSASLGEDSLRAGLIAGIIGTALVLVYMLFYYRALGLVVIAGLAVWFGLQWSIISFLGESQGLALSLAGVTGIIVSVGVTVDSYVVYFERLKDEIRAGRTLRTSVDQGFKRAFRTILIADTSAFLGAATLYILTVGAVRGFAFYLGLATILDVVVSWFFTRPVVSYLAQKGFLNNSKFIRVVPLAEGAKPSLWYRLYNGMTNFQFVPHWRRWFAISGAVILIGLLSLFTRGLNLGIDFEGGVSWESQAGAASVSDVRDALSGSGLEDPDIQSLGTSDGEVIRVQAEEVGDADRSVVTDAIAEVTGQDPADVSFNEVGPSWGEEITEKAIRALVIFLVLVSLYIALRFEWKMAMATLAALLHDILVTVGVYSVIGFQVTPATVIAFLTILGYSIYDGIVVFDRVDENAKALSGSGSTTYSRMVNDSMNQVLMRTLNTSITALLPIASLLVIGSLVLGASTLEDFALALFIGLLSGAYSSIFIASPLLALLKEREPRWRALRERIGSRGYAPAPAMAMAGVGARGDDEPVAGDSENPSLDAAEQRVRDYKRSTTIQPRGRKKSRRR